MKTLKYFLPVVFFSLLNHSVVAQKSWKDIVSTEDLYMSYPALVDQLFDDINLDYPGLEKVKEAVAEGNRADAQERLQARGVVGNEQQSEGHHGSSGRGLDVAAEPGPRRGRERQISRDR